MAQQHTWSIDTVATAHEETAPTVTAPIVARVVATCTACGEVRVFPVAVGNQTVNLTGSCLRPSGATAGT
jgi:hypothetical protein